MLVCSFAQLVMATTLLRHIALHLQGYCMIMGNIDGSLVDTNVSHVHIKQAFRQTTQIRIRNQRHWYNKFKLAKSIVYLGLHTRTLNTSSIQQ